MAEEGGIEIKAKAALFRVVHPRLEMLRPEFIPLRPVFLRHDGVAGVQIQPFLARNQAAGLVKIGGQLFEGAGLAGIVSGGLNAAGKGFSGVFQPGHVIPLPAMNRDRNLLQSGNSGIGVYAPRGVAFFGFLIHAHFPFSFGINVFSSKSARICSRAWERSFSSPSAISCAMALPSAVPSPGPANTGKPVASAVH